MKAIGSVTDFLEVTLVDGIIIRDITDMELISIEPDENKEDFFKVILTNELGNFESTLSADDFYMLTDDLDK